MELLSKKVILKVVYHLELLVKSKEKSKKLKGLVGSDGVCQYIRGIFEEQCAYTMLEIQSLMDIKATEWEHFSGDTAYPVGLDNMSGLYLDDLYHTSEFKEKWVKGEYADNRWLYIDHIIAAFKEEAHNYE